MRMILFAMATMSMASRLTQPSLTQQMGNQAPPPAPSVEQNEWQFSLSAGAIGTCEREAHAEGLGGDWQRDQSVLEGCKYRALELLKQEEYWADWKVLRIEAAHGVPDAAEHAEEMVKRGLVINR
jgi:hypothetical protein